MCFGGESGEWGEYQLHVSKTVLVYTLKLDGRSLATSSENTDLPFTKHVIHIDHINRQR